MNIKFAATAQCPLRSGWISSLFAVYSVAETRSGSVSVLDAVMDEVSSNGTSFSAK